MGYKKTRHPRAGLNRYWLTLPLVLAAGLIVSQIADPQPVFAESELSPTRIIDEYNFVAGAFLAQVCQTRERPIDSPFGPRTERFHVCRIALEGDSGHRHNICIPIAQLALGNGNNDIHFELANHKFTYSKDISLLTGDNFGVCERPRGSNAVLPQYKSFHLQCQREDRDSLEEYVSSLLVSNPQLVDNCQLIAWFEHATDSFVAPRGHERINGWGGLTGCSKKSEGFNHEVLACQVRSASASVCLNTIRTGADYSGFDRNSYYIEVRSTSLLNTDCHGFDSGSITTKLYVHCTELDHRLQADPNKALEDGKCELIVFASSGQAGVELSEGADFSEVITINCPSDDCGFLKTVNNFLGWMAFLVVPIVVIVVIVGGIQLSLSSDNPEATKKAKMRIIQAVTALVFYALLWSVLRWLI